MGVNATAVWSLRPIILVCLGSGTIVEVFRQMKTEHCDKDVLKLFVSLVESWTTCSGTPSGPAALRMLILRRSVCSTSAVCGTSAWLLVAGTSQGRNLPPPLTLGIKVDLYVTLSTLKTLRKRQS